MYTYVCTYLSNETNETNERTNESVSRSQSSAADRETIGVPDTFDRGVRDATNVANISASQRDYELLTRAALPCYWPERHASASREPGQYNVGFNAESSARERQWPREHRWVLAGI